MIDVKGNALGFVACGTIMPDDKQELAQRLLDLHSGLTGILAEYRPDEAAVEATFVNKDPQGTLKLGQARGIALLVPAQAALQVAEYAPNLVKKSVVGAGHADKAQIRHMIKVLLPKSDARSDDAADALAVAITHAHHRGAARLAAMLQRA